MPERCPSFVTVGIDRTVRCDRPAGHGPAEDIHRGLLRVVLTNGSEHAASLVWSTSPCSRDEENLSRSH